MLLFDTFYNNLKMSVIYDTLSGGYVFRIFESIFFIN